jgi:hypothetical protein
MKNKNSIIKKNRSVYKEPKRIITKKKKKLSGAVVKQQGAHMSGFEILPLDFNYQIFVIFMIFSVAQ